MRSFQLKESIIQIIKKRKIDELNPKYLSLLSDIEYDELIYKLYFKYNLKAEIVSDHSLLIVLLHITRDNNLLDDFELLKEIYDKLDLIHTYWELSILQEDNPLHDVTASLMHINGLLTLVESHDKEKYIFQYRDYVQRLFSFPVSDSEDTAAMMYVLHLFSVTLALNNGNENFLYLSNLVKDPLILERISNVFSLIDKKD